MISKVNLDLKTKQKLTITHVANSALCRIHKYDQFWNQI